LKVTGEVVKENSAPIQNIGHLSRKGFKIVDDVIMVSMQIPRRVGMNIKRQNVLRKNQRKWRFHLNGYAKQELLELLKEVDEIKNLDHIVALHMWTDLGAGTCEAMRATYKLDYHMGTPATINDEFSAKIGRKVAKEVFGEKGLVDYPPQMGGGDFAKYLMQTPGSLLFLGGGNAKEGKKHPHHSSKFEIDEKAFFS